MKISRLDHLVLTVRDIQTTIDFYTQVLGMEAVTFAKGRTALIFGSQKINLHQVGNEFEPKAGRVMPGSADLCFILGHPVEEAVDDLKKQGVALIEGPVERTGAVGEIRSVYFRDPDQNLIEVSEYLEQTREEPEHLRPNGEFEWP